MSSQLKIYVPVDTKKGCEYLESPEYGYVKTTGSHAGSLALYKCQEGYELYGSRKRRCLSNGYWSGVKPTCKGECSDDKLNTENAILFISMVKVSVH